MYYLISFSLHDWQNTCQLRNKALHLRHTCTEYLLIINARQSEINSSFKKMRALFVWWSGEEGDRGNAFRKEFNVHILQGWSGNDASSLKDIMEKGWVSLTYGDDNSLQKVNEHGLETKVWWRDRGKGITLSPFRIVITIVHVHVNTRHRKKRDEGWGVKKEVVKEEKEGEEEMESGRRKVTFL